ncbi:thiamine pyrophosphokinase [Oxobacter pfennigii]|uniref:Thiamine diphosphokinase n=1 Tax=Oxobacter pfennigii TaxID=36849 RepID=A0A0P8W5L7_9CLOT|nr:thiamine diphosphokinase [Oxobacter pfennigii]KPU43970.1 thiamine pyrophosphokinase [Oxobacter pfennigii]
MKAAVVSHGTVKDISHLKALLNECQLLVCADGGAQYVLNCGMFPDAVIGDLDSIDENILKKLVNNNVEIIKYPKEKDFTDTELAIDYCINKDADEIMLLGSIGDRMDHTLANILLLVKLVGQNIKACIINEKNRIYITDSSLSLKGNVGDILSLIPVSGDVQGVRTNGLQYELSGATLSFGSSIGISNVFMDEEISVTIDSGYLLIIKSND